MIAYLWFGKLEIPTKSVIVKSSLQAIIMFYWKRIEKKLVILYCNRKDWPAKEFSTMFYDYEYKLCYALLCFDLTRTHKSGSGTAIRCLCIAFFFFSFPFI